MTNYPFAMVELPGERSPTKPRSKGLTMMVDWGVPMARQKDLLSMIAPYLDLAKIAVGTSRLYDEEYLRDKLRLYKEYQVRPFLGGQFQEYVFATQGFAALAPFLDEAKRVGFEVVEVSDNVVPLTPEERKAQIALAIDRGLTVFGEVGSKSEKSAAATLIAQGRDCVEAGAELVIVEGAELMAGGQPKEALLADLRGGLDISRALFELPGPWIRGVTLSDIHDLKKFLIREFGPDVNIANVMPDDLLETEALRVGLGVVGAARSSEAVK